MNIPEDLQYSIEHTWLRVEGSTGTIGITEFAQSELGEIVYVDLPNIGFVFRQNTVFGSVEAIKTVSDLFMPVSGKVLETNKQLLQEPTLVNTDPYGQGWIIKIELETTAELDNLVSAEAYKQKISQ
jgi:glycine cleavage system H protein